MSEFCFNVKQEILTKNIELFAKRAAKYGVRYTVQPLAFDEARVSLEGSCNSKIALLAGILAYKEEE